MLGEATFSLKCQNWSAEVAKKGNFSSFLDFSQKTNERICSNCTQMFVFPCPIHWRDRFGRTISTRVGPKKKRAVHTYISNDPIKYLKRHKMSPLSSSSSWKFPCRSPLICRSPTDGRRVVSSEVHGCYRLSLLFMYRVGLKSGP